MIVLFRRMCAIHHANTGSFGIERLTLNYVMSIGFGSLISLIGTQDVVLSIHLAKRSHYLVVMTRFLILEGGVVQPLE